MKKNKIITVVICVICLISVLSVQAFAVFGGDSNYASLYTEATFVKPDFIYLDNYYIGGTNYDNWITLPCCSMSGRNWYDLGVPLLTEFFGMELYNFSDNGYNVRIGYDVSSSDAGFEKIGIKYEDSSIAFKDKTSLISYLRGSTDVCPAYISDFGNSFNSQINFGFTATIFNGNDEISTTEIGVSIFDYQNYNYGIIDEAFYDLGTWVSNQDLPNGWLTLQLSDIELWSSGDFNCRDLQYCNFTIKNKQSLFLPNDNLSHNAVAETIVDEQIKYDLNPLQFIFDTVNQFFAIELFPNPISPGNSVTFGGITAIILGLFGLSFILKALAGK